MHEQAATVQNSLEEEISSVQNGLSGELSSIENRLTEKMNVIEYTLSTATTESQKTADELAQISEENANILGSFQAESQRRVDELEEQYRKAYEEALAQVNGMEQDVLNRLANESKENTENLRIRNEQQLENLRSIFVQQVEELREGFVKQVTSLQSELHEQAATVQSSLEEKISNVQNSLTTDLSSVQDSFTGKISSVQIALAAATEAAEKTAAETSASSENLAILQEDIRRRAESLEMQYKEAYEQALIAAEQKEHDALSRFSAISNDNTDKFRRETESRLIELQEDFQNKVQQLEDILVESEKNTQHVADRIEIKLQDLNGDIANKITEITNTTSDFRNQNQKDLQDAFAVLEENIRSSADEMNKAIARINDTWQEAEQKTNNIAQDISRQNESIMARMEDFVASTSEKIQEFDENLLNSMKHIAADYDMRQANFLSDLDKQLEDYKADMQYRFDRLDTAGADVDNLEAALQQAMLEAKNRVMQEFQRFNSEQQEQQANFELAIRKNSDDIANQLTSLENELNALKSSAYDNVSSKLQDFEKEFFEDLTQRGENITTELTHWKDQFDNKLKVMTSDFESERHNLEVQYNDDLKERLSTLQEKNRDYLVKFETSVKQSESVVQDKMAFMEQDLREFMEQYRSKLEETKNNIDTQLQKDLESHASSTAEQLAKFEHNVSEKITQINEQTFNSQEKNRNTIDGLLSELSAWQSRMDSQFSESKSLFDSKLANLEQNSSDMLMQLQSSFKSDISVYADKINEEHNSIAEQLEKIKVETKQTFDTFENRASMVMEEFQKAYDGMLEENQRRIREQNSDAEQKLRALKAMVMEIKDKIEASQADVVLKLQNRTTEMNMVLDDIDKRIKNCSAQIPMIDKTNELKSQLDSDLLGLQSDMTKLESFKTEISNLESELHKIRQMEDEVNLKLTNFATEKKHIENLEGDFNKLMSLSSTMDQKISELQTVNDDLQNMQVEIRRYQDTLANISTRYDRLEKKNNVLDRTILDVDNAFKNLEQIEKRLTQCDTQIEQLPEKIETVRRDVDRLVDNSGRISDAIEKLDSLDGVIEEAKVKIEEVMNARDGITRSESRLRDIAKQADDQLKLLSALMKQDTAKSGPAVGAPPISTRERVIQLVHQNWKPAEIARALNLTLGEVELILEMPQI